MAKYLDLTGLTEYDTKIKQYIASAISGAKEIGVVEIEYSASAITLTEAQVAELQKDFAIIITTIGQSPILLCKSKYSSSQVILSYIDVTTSSATEYIATLTISGRSLQFASRVLRPVTTAGTGLSLDNNTLNHSNSITAGTAGTSSATSGSNTLDVPYVTYDAQGHVTASGTHTHTITKGSIASSNEYFVDGGTVYTALQGKQDSMTAITNAEVDALFA